MELVLEGEFLLERFPGKGGWTFVRVPVTLLPGGKAFGMLKVCGSVDDFEVAGKYLMPMGKGILFLPIAKLIRAQIGKEEGDVVQIKLYREAIPTEIPQELIDCLQDYPGKLLLFYQLEDAAQKHWIAHIYSAGSEETKAERIVKLLTDLVGKT